MSDGSDKMTFHDLEPLISDADNMLDVLVNTLDKTGLTSNDVVLTDPDRELISFMVNVAVDMTQKVRKAYYAIEGKGPGDKIAETLVEFLEGPSSGRH
ncbi:hypothetical protein NKH72_32120 [Mesorhizobium sp. M0955]|uniref:hypothetical protein n=1 Tax=Mesorhizobium sp. M0955 TaxID=2957033 RepID=UPI00333B8830